MYLPSHADAQRQHGLITHAQAAASGLLPTDIARRVRTQEWVRVRKGVYADGEDWRSLDVHRGRPLLGVHAASLVLTTPGAFSHDSAALLHGMGVPDGPAALVHRTRPDVHGSRRRAGIKHHGAPVDPRDLGQRSGQPALGLARTAVDLAREHGLEAGVAACDEVLRLGVTRAELRRVVASMSSWPGIRAARQAVELADPGAESYGESLGRVLVLELGIGRPETQFGLSDGSRVVWCDMRVGRHVFEFDGLLKYRVDNPSRLPPEQVLWREKQRQDFISGMKLGVSRITTPDLYAGRGAALRRLAREYRTTVDRWGHDISDLAPYIVRRDRADGFGSDM